MNLPISVSRTSLFQILGVLGGIFHLDSNSNRTICKHTVETLIRRHVLWRLIWVFTVWLCPIKRTLDLYGLIKRGQLQSIVSSGSILFTLRALLLKGQLLLNFEEILKAYYKKILNISIHYTVNPRNFELGLFEMLANSK